MRSNKARARVEVKEPSDYAFRVMSVTSGTSSTGIDLKIHQASQTGIPRIRSPHAQRRQSIACATAESGRSVRLHQWPEPERKSLSRSLDTVRLGSWDRRKSRRFPIVIQLEYRIYQTPRSVDVGIGETINIGSHGVLFRAALPFQTGLFLELSLDWPLLHQMRERLQLRPLGRVVRVEADLTAVQLFRPALTRGAKLI